MTGAAGTEWTEPKRGSTCSELAQAVKAHEGMRDAYRHLAHLASGKVRMFWNRPTNLKLTGAPLTAEDLKRIEAAK